MVQYLKKEVDTIKNANGGNAKPRKAVQSYRCKNQQQNTRDRGENLRHKQYLRGY